MLFINESAARNLIVMSVLSIASLLGCARFAATPSLFPNPVEVTIDDLPQPLQDKLQQRYSDDQIRKIQYSAETQQYGVTGPSGTIFLYDATGRKIGEVL